jgi:hypothetical protein
MKPNSASLPATEIPGHRIVLFLMVALLFLYLRSFFFPGTPLAAQYDAVFFFEHAKRILLGQVPFRDFFEFVMPGTDLLYAGIFRVFGVHAWLAADIVILLGLALTAVVLRISQKIFHGNTAFLPPLLFLIFDFDSARDATHHWYSTLFVLMAALVLLSGRTPRRVFCAGILCGIATLFTQSQGLFGFVSIAVFLIAIGLTEKQSRALLVKHMAILGVPLIVIVGGVVGYYSYRAGAHVMVYALWQYPVIFTATQYSLPLFPELALHQSHTEIVRSVFQICLYLFVPLSYVFCLLLVFRRRDRMDRQVWAAMLLVNLVGFGLLATLASGPGYHRLCTVAPPAMIAFVCIVNGERAMDRGVRFALWTISIALVLILPIRLQHMTPYYLDLPTGRTAFLNKDQFVVDKWLAERTHQNDLFFGLAFPSFTLGLQNPTPLDFTYPTGMTPPVLEDAIVLSLQRHPAKFIFLQNPKPWDKNDSLPNFLRLVHSNYHLAKKFPSGEFWEKNDQNAALSSVDWNSR